MLNSSSCHDRMGQLNEILAELEHLLSVPENLDDSRLEEAVRIGQIKKFESALDLAHDIMLCYVNRNGRTENTDLKVTAKNLYEQRLISGVLFETLLEMAGNRNRFVALCITDHFGEIRHTLTRYKAALHEICAMLEGSFQEEKKWLENY